MKCLLRVYQIALTLLVGFASFSLLANTHNNSLNTVIVITANNTPLQQVDHARNMLAQRGQQLVVHNLDAIQAFEDNISEGLPNNEAQAKIAFQQRLEKMGKARFKAQLLQAYQGLFIATKYQIDRYPAIIFDNQTVIYGVTNLKQALQRYQTHRSHQMATSSSNKGVTSHE